MPCSREELEQKTNNLSNRTKNNYLVKINKSRIHFSLRSAEYFQVICELLCFPSEKEKQKNGKKGWCNVVSLSCCLCTRVFRGKHIFSEDNEYDRP